jgi:Type I phosphodiesterase / nucleotide pyrophosphatase
VSGGPDRRVDELRDQLRALGYLDARVDRFVLGSAARRDQPVTLAAAASVRIGMLAGALLGPAAAIGLGARLPGLVTNTTDAVVLAGYLAVLFGLAAGVFAFLATLVAGQAARRASDPTTFPARARRAATAAGLVVTAACLVYLALWWRTTLLAAASGGVAATAAAMAVAVAISLLLGHGVTVTSLAYFARVGGSAGAPAARLPLSSWKATLPVGLIAFVGAMALLFATSAGQPNTADAPPLTVVSTGQHVDVIAIDGVDLATLDRLRAAGRLPRFSQLLGQSVATLSPEPDRDPAKVWTTIATGQPPEKHGIRGLESRQIAGVGGQFQSGSRVWSALTAATDFVRLTRPAIASGEQRLIPAFWEVAARAGLRTAVVHWWATWPAPQDLGIVISDRAILRLEAGGPLDSEIAPPSLYDTLKKDWSDRRAEAAAAAERATPPGTPPEIAAVFTRAANLDHTVVALAVADLGVLDLRVVYLPGLDIVQHALFGSEQPAAMAPSDAADRLKALEAYYVFLDETIGAFVTPASGSDRTCILVTEPGRVTTSSLGLIAVAGTPASAERPTATTTSVAATVLYALGVPVARDLASAAVTDLFSTSFVTTHPVRNVETYGLRRLAPQPAKTHTLDREMIERMRTLGYIR